MRFHPFCEAFPLVEGDAFEELVADIRAYGLREDIWTYGGLILDGRNRFRACQEANEKPRFRVFVGSDEAAITLVKSANVHRRHLTASQRALAFAELAKWAQKGRPKTLHPVQSFPENTSSIKTLHEIAEEAHVSDRTMHQAKAVADKGSKKLKESVRAGDVSIKKAAGVVDLPKAEQLAAAHASDEPEGAEPEGHEAAQLEAALKEQDAAIERVLGTAGVEELKRQAAEIAILKQSRDGFMNGKAAVEKLLATEQRKVTRLQKRIEELEAEVTKLRARQAA